MPETFSHTPERIDGKLTRWGKFAQHRRDAKARGIAFDLTFDQWLSIWCCSGKWRKRGRKLGRYVMARFGDLGPYAVNNVMIMRCEENHHTANIGKPRPKTKEWASQHSKTMRGRKHTKAHNAKISLGVRRALAQRGEQA